MKFLKPLLILCALGAFAAAQAANFEGKISMQMTDAKKRSTTMDYMIKDPKARIEVVIDPKKPDAKAVSIVDSQAQEILVFMPEQKMYMSMKMKDAAETAKKVRDDVDDGGFQKTSETETILGYKTTKYINTSKKGEITEIWATEELGSFYGLGGGENSPFKNMSKNNWEKEMAEKGAFPLRTVMKDKKGKETMRMEATSIKKESIPDSAFAIPEGYQKFDLGGMFKNAFGGGK